MSDGRFWLPGINWFDKNCIKCPDCCFTMKFDESVSVSDFKMQIIDESANVIFETNAIDREQKICLPAGTYTIKLIAKDETKPFVDLNDPDVGILPILMLNPSETLFNTVDITEYCGHTFTLTRD